MRDAFSLAYDMVIGRRGGGEIGDEQAEGPSEIDKWRYCGYRCK